MENTTTDTAAFPDAIQDETIEQPEPATDNEVARDIYEESIECELTEEDKAHKRERLETVDREIIRLEEEKKAAAKVFTNQIKPLQAERDSILLALDQGTEKRMVPVYELVIERLGKVEVRRVDDDSVVEERAMTQQELDDVAAAKQGSLFGDDDGGGSVPPPEADEPSDIEEDLEPDPEAMAQAAVDENRVVKINSKEARSRKTKRSVASEGESA